MNRPVIFVYKPPPYRADHGYSIIVDDQARSDEGESATGVDCVVSRGARYKACNVIHSAASIGGI